MAFSLSSDAFSGDNPIPPKYTCDGDGLSPALRWEDPPAGTRSLALIVDDPDAPRRTFVHWVVYDIPPGLKELPEGAAAHPPAPSREGLNDGRRAAYVPFCPPSGRHRYVHKLYALDIQLGDRGRLTKAELEQAMAGHILAHAELVGTYQRHH